MLAIAFTIKLVRLIPSNGKKLILKAYQQMKSSTSLLKKNGETNFANFFLKLATVLRPYVPARKLLISCADYTILTVLIRYVTKLSTTVKLPI